MQITVRRYIENYLDTLGEKVYFRAECDCDWNGKLRSGKMGRATAGKDAKKHDKEHVAKLNEDIALSIQLGKETDSAETE